jgi:3-oxoacyl-[acyl-carrier protein] reductase
MTQGEFSGLTALVTGGSIGIGAETAVGLARGGAHVLIHYNTSADEAADVLSRVRTAGGDGELLKADLGTRPGVEAFCESIKDREIDILVNNAGSLVERRKILEFTWDLYERVMMLNITSAFFVTQAMLGKMAARGRGVVVNVGSIAGRTGGGVGASVYATAKGALETLTKAQAKEFAPQGVRVNGVSPGTVDTKFHRQFSTAQMLEGVRAMTPVGRLGTSEEIADVIVYLCSEKAAFIHGQMIEVNGGFYML